MDKNKQVVSKQNKGIADNVGVKENRKIRIFSLPWH